MRAIAWGCLLLGCGVVAFATRARAESAVDAPLACAYGSPDVTPPAGTIPANWPLFTIDLHGSALVPESTTMTRSSDGHVVPLAFATRFGPSAPVRFAPREALVVGETYVVDHPSCPGVAPRTTTYLVAASIAAPASLGTLTVSGPFATNERQGVCHREVFVVITLTPDPAFGAEPWSSFDWVPSVDGVATRAAASVGTRTTRLYLPCGEQGGLGTLGEGTHAIAASAGPWTVGSARALATFDAAPIAFTARCADAVRVDATTLAPLSPGEATYWDTDVGTCAMDAGHVAGMDAGLVDGGRGEPPAPAPSCACATPRASSGWAGVLALAWIATRRRALRRAGS